MLKIFTATIFFFSLTISSALAQEKSGTLSSRSTDWSVFVDNSPKQCWVVSSPRSVTFTKMMPKHADILLMVSFRPSQKIFGQVGYLPGYELREGAEVTLIVGSQKFDLFVSGSWAYTEASAVDAKVVAAFRSGKKATIKIKQAIASPSSSSKYAGVINETTHVFSLMGFSAAFNDAKRRCGM